MREESVARNLCPAISLWFGLIAGTLPIGAWPAVADPAPHVDARLWGTDATPTAMARGGNTLYLAGPFHRVGPCTGGGVAVDADSGRLERPQPAVTGVVQCSAPDGAGGWYIGGYFTDVGGVRRSNLAHVLASGAVSDWAPAFDDGVWALVLEGHTLYASGVFHAVDRSPRRFAAAVDVESGALLPWNPDPDDYVFTMASGSSGLLLGGHFTAVGGQPRARVASVDRITGAPLDWNPGADDDVTTLAVANGTVYVGGRFQHLGGQVRKLIGAVDEVSGAVAAFDPAAEGGVADPLAGVPSVFAIAPADSVVYVAGNFSGIGGQSRASIAALDARTGAATTWNPLVGPIDPDFLPPLVSSIERIGSRVYFGGAFTQVSGIERDGVAAVDAATGELSRWDPRAMGTVVSIAVSDTQLYLGGLFDSMGDWQLRRNLMALDLTTGQPTAWTPHVEGMLTIDALAILDSTVYVGGTFGGINGEPRAGLAAIDVRTGEVLPWNPAPFGGTYTDVIRAIIATPAAIYVGGDFGNIGGAARSHLAALDPVTGVALPWSPEANSMVAALAMKGEAIYAAGFFDHVGGESRLGLAAIERGTGAVLPWNPGCDGIPTAFAMTDSALYVAGSFDIVGGLPRAGLASLDPATGAPSSWAPPILGSEVGHTENFAVATSNGMVFLGGDFTNVGSDHRFCLAAIDAATGVAESWDPASDSRVFAMASEGDTVYVGGNFHVLGGLPRAGLAAIIVPKIPAPQPQLAVGVATIRPNPCRSSASIRFATPSSGSTTIRIYDLQGRKVADVLDRGFLPPGQQEVVLPTAGLRAGLYVCSLKTDWFETSRKLVVVR